MISRSLGKSRQHNEGPDQRVYAECAVCHSSLLRITQLEATLPFLFFFFCLFLSREDEIAQMASKSTSKSFKGCTLFRHRIVTATLSGKPIRISDIRSNTVSHASYIHSNQHGLSIHSLFGEKEGRAAEEYVAKACNQQCLYVFHRAPILQHQKYSSVHFFFSLCYSSISFIYYL